MSAMIYNAADDVRPIVRLEFSPTHLWTCKRHAYGHDQGHINTPTDADIRTILIIKHKKKKNKERKGGT